MICLRFIEMQIGTYTFESQKEAEEPLVLKPRREFDLKEFLKEAEVSLRLFSRCFPFFTIRDAVLDEGSPIGNQGDGVNTHFHYDAGEIVVLANNFEANERGKTEWVPNQALIRAFTSELGALREFTSGGFYSPQIAAGFTKLLDESHTRENLNQLLGALYCTNPLPPVLTEILRGVDRRVYHDLETCVWREHPRSALVFNNDMGFHRGVYNKGAGEVLRRVVV